jgi:methylglyoxal synthase
MTRKMVLIWVQRKKTSMVMKMVMAAETMAVVVKVVLLATGTTTTGLVIQVPQMEGQGLKNANLDL